MGDSQNIVWCEEVGVLEIMYKICLGPQLATTDDYRRHEGISLNTYQHSQCRYQCDDLHDTPEREEESRDHRGGSDGLTAATALSVMTLPTARNE